MKARHKTSPAEEFDCSRFNAYGLGEVLTGDDSVFASDLEVFVEAKQAWKCLAQALRDRDIISNNHDTCFSEPRTEEERVRGWCY